MAKPKAIADRDTGGSCSMCTLSAPKGGRAAKGGGRVHVLSAQMTDRDGKYYARACAFDDGDEGCFDTLVDHQRFVSGATRAAAEIAVGLLGDDEGAIRATLEDLRR